MSETTEATGQSVFIDAKGRRWTPHLTARAVWKYEEATGVSLFSTVFGLADDDAEARMEAGKKFAGVPEDLLRVALKLFGRPQHVALLIYEGCEGTPEPAVPDLILVDESSGALVRAVASMVRGVRWLCKPSSRRRRLTLDDLGNAIRTNQQMGLAILCAYQAVLDFFPQLDIDAAQDDGAEKNR